MRERFDRRAFSSTTSADVEVELRALIAKHPGKFSLAQLHAWLHEPGLPADVAPAKSARVDTISAIATAYALTGEAFSVEGWTTVDWVIFLRALPPEIALVRLRTLDQRHNLTTSPNAQIQMYWFPLLVKADARDAAPAIESYLVRIGRRWLISGVYEALIVKGGTWKELAKQSYERAKPLYHPIVRETIEKMLKG